MRFIRLGLVGALAFLPAFAQDSNGSLLQDTTEKILPRHHGPIRDLTDHGDGTSTSTNWSGYAALGSSFVWAKGSWIVPTATCTGVTRDQYAAFWVGLDGYSSTTVEQTGTDSDCDGATPSYYAWYEFYPKASVEITSVPIKPGDAISAIVYYDSSTEKFIIEIIDETTGKSYATSSAVAGAVRSSAEWITEAPCCTLLGGILPLSDFGTVSFGKDSTGVAATNWALDSSTEGAIGSFPAVDVIEINKTASTSSPETSDCSALSTDKTSFTCTWAQ
jgi:Peptidase A4 family